MPCLGYGAGGLRVGYGGGFVARTLRPPTRLVTVGLAYSVSWVPGLQALTDEAPLDAILTDESGLGSRAGNDARWASRSRRLSEKLPGRQIGSRGTLASRKCDQLLFRV